MVATESDPLIGGADGRSDESAFVVKDGYSSSPTGLASVVSQSQLGALQAFGGVDGLWSIITSGSSGSRTGALKDGLSANNPEALKGLQTLYGSNALPLPPSPNMLDLMLTALADPTMLMLLASAAVSLVLGLGIERDFEKGWIEGTSIMVTVCLVVSVTAVTDYSKAREFRQQQLQLENGKHVDIVRNGNGTGAAAVTRVHPRELVVGDVVRLAVGDICPADGVLFQASHDLQLDESALTGETQLIHKSAWKKQQDADQDESSLDPFIVSGTNVMQGSGLFMVLAVGSNSIQGKILARIREQQDDDDDDTQAHDDQHEQGDGGGGWWASIKSFFSFSSLSGDLQGATLMEKLDTLAMDIGKVGLLVALVMFLVLLTEWIYKEFFLDVKCSLPSLLEDEASCLAVKGCDVDKDSSENEMFACVRRLNVEDVSTVLGYFITAITILVVAVPEGLPLAVTLALAVSMRRMMKDANQVKHMDSTETMGSATTICSDKTGTLTENKMTAMKLSYAGQEYEHVVGSAGADDNTSLGSIVQEKSDMAQQRQLAEAVLLNVAPTSKVTLPQDGGPALYEGNPTDCALMKLALQLGFDATSVRAPFQGDTESMIDWGVYNIPFSSERKRMSWIVQQATNGTDAVRYSGQYRLYSKGAPQQIFDACSFVITSFNKAGVAQKEALGKDKKQAVMDLVSSWQDKGLRTLALAYRDINKKPVGGWDSEARSFETGMSLLAVVGIEDPLRASVPRAIVECHKAGIDVRMCTGDALSTAIAIAKGCKILRDSDMDSSTGLPKPNFAMTGAEFDDRVHRKDPSKPKIVRRVFDPKINDAVDSLAEPFLLDESGNKVLDQKAFDDLWPTIRVLARCQPEDKLTLVRGMRKSRVFLDDARCAKLQSEHGIRIFPDYQVVAVTGDGTNDAPALKSANVGFAMGIAGTETAKQACDIILLDDNFASIIKAVMWGRNVFDSISKFIQFQLTVNVVAITLAVVGAFSYNESPLTAVQMLWVNMIMDSLASLALATEQPTEELLDRMPYGKRRPVISPIMAGNIIGHSIYQIAILCWVLFRPESLPFLDPPVSLDPTRGSLHWSLFFNVFVMLQLFNEFNARRLATADKLRTTLSEWNVFSGISTNPMFGAIMVATFSLQILIVEWGGEAVNVISGGLSRNQWAFCVGAGAMSLVWQLVIHLCVVLFAASEDAALSRPKRIPESHAEAEAATASKWDAVRLGVRRDILYARVLGTSVRSGHKLGNIVRCAASRERSEEYYKVLGAQMSSSRRKSVVK